MKLSIDFFPSVSGAGGKQNSPEHKYLILLLVKFNHTLKIELYPNNVTSDIF